MGEEKNTNEEVKLDEIDMEESKDVAESTEKPVEKSAPIAEVKKKKSSKKNFLKVILIILVILALAATAGAYWLRDQAANDLNVKQSAEITTLQAAKTSLQKQLAVEKAKTTTITPEPTTCSDIAPAASVIENIKASITSGNTQALEGYMAASVNVIIAATEGVGPSTPAVAVSNVTSFISSETFEVSSWDFALPASVLSSYGSDGYAQYFPSIAVVGKSVNNKVISFSFDCNGDIDGVFLAASSELL